MAASLVQYAKKMGLLKAVSLYASKTFRKTGEGSVHLPGFVAPVWARFGTSDLGVFRHVLIDEGYRFRPSVQPGLIIDAGANVGYASVYFANRFPGAAIIAIEPDTDNFHLLQRNTAAYPRIRCIQAGLWSKDCFLRISNPGGGTCAFRVEETMNPENAIPAVTLLTLLESSGFDRIGILKLDIEGAEKELFLAHNSVNWIARTDVMAIELHDRLMPGCEAAMLQAVQGLPFKVSQRGENTFLSRY